MSNLFALSYSNKKKTRNILLLDKARHIFVTKKWKLQEVIGSICPQSIENREKGVWESSSWREKNTGIRTQKRKEKGDTKRSTSRWSELPYRWYAMVMFHCCTKPSSLEMDINAKHSPRSGQTVERTRLSNPNSCRINLCIERRKDSLLKFYKYNFVEL
jgi:hypothetical protein